MGKIFRPTHYTESDLANEGFKHLGKNVRIARNCTIVGPENISIADNVRIDGYCTIVATGTGYLDLGSYIHVGGYCALLAAEGIVRRFGGWDDAAKALGLSIPDKRPKTGWNAPLTDAERHACQRRGSAEQAYYPSR